MRKTELIQIHGLLVLIRRHLAELAEIVVPAGAFDVYDAYGVRPTAIAERKDAHKGAVGHLISEIRHNTRDRAGDYGTSSDVVGVHRDINVPVVVQTIPDP